MMGEITISEGLAWLIGICSGLITISKAAEIIRKIVGKKDTADKISAMNSRLDNHETRIGKLEAGQINYEKSNGIMFRAMLNLLEHVRTGNAKEKLLESEAELQKFLTNR